MTESQALLALARAQKAMVTLTKHSLRQDQVEGLNNAVLAKKHVDLYWEIREAWLSRGLISEEEATDADTAGGLNA